MDDRTFWQIIEETRDTSMERQEETLYERLKALPEKEILEFYRLETLRYWELYSWELWGVAHLYWGGCSDDSFMDWRCWLIHCGREAFETARDRPDELVPIIDAHPDAGGEEIAYVTMRVLREKDPKWEDAYPEFDVPRPERPRGVKWSEEDLKELLPKTYKRFVKDASEQEKRWKDPEYLRETFGLKLGEEKVYTTKSEQIMIDGQPARRTLLVPVAKKPWWKFW